MKQMQFIHKLNGALATAGCFNILVDDEEDELYSKGLTSIELLMTIVNLEKELGLKLNPALVPQLGRLTVRDLRIALGAEL